MLKTTALWLVSILVLAFFVLIGGLALTSSKTTPAFTDDNGTTLTNSIAEIRDVTINGTSQRILIRGENRDNPLLLQLHGGPGGPDQAIIQSTGKTVEDLFTVVYWDQRGTGASYNESTRLQPLTLEQISSDGIALSKMLLNEFGQNKLYLQGHSWGSLLGVEMASQAPELFQAYFGIGQFANGMRAEKLSWDFALSAAKNAQDQSTVNALMELGSPPYNTDQEWIDKVMVQRALMIPYENPNQGPVFTMADFYRQFYFYEGYNISEKIGMLSAPSFSMQQLWPAVINSNLLKTHTQFEVPIYIFQGKYDQHTVTQVAKEYFDVINAPEKNYFSFDQSAHWPHINEYTKYRGHLKSILSKTKVDN